MNILNKTVRAVIIRPSILIIPAILGFFFYLFNAYNPITSIITGIASITGSTVFDSLVSGVQMLVDPAFTPAILIFLFIAILLGSLFAGLILSGYFNIVDSAVEGVEKKRGEFGKGLRRNFLKYFLVSLRAFPFMAFLGVFMLISGLPAIIVTRAAMTDKPGLLIAAVFVDILTAAVLLFTSLFSAAYILFWYPSASKVAKKSFTYAKRAVDRHFWAIISRISVFGIVFVFIHYAIFGVGSYLMRHVLGCLFDTAFFTTLAVYLFDTFKTATTPSGDGK